MSVLAIAFSAAALFENTLDDAIAKIVEAKNHLNGLKNSKKEIQSNAMKKKRELFEAIADLKATAEVEYLETEKYMNAHMQSENALSNLNEIARSSDSI